MGPDGRAVIYSVVQAHEVSTTPRRLFTQEQAAPRPNSPSFDSQVSTQLLLVSSLAEHNTNLLIDLLSKKSLD